MGKTHEFGRETVAGVSCPCWLDRLLLAAHQTATGRKAMLKFLVFSDLHLVDEGDTSHGLDTYSRFAKGVDWVNTHHADADFCGNASLRKSDGPAKTL